MSSSKPQLLAELAVSDLDRAARDRAAAAFAGIEWTDELDRVAAWVPGRPALLRGAAFGFERHGMAILDAIVRDHLDPLPNRRIGDHGSTDAEVAAARAFLLDQFGRVRGRAMEAMFAALDEATSTGRPLTLSERNFLDHELLEASYVAAGHSQRDAHLRVHETIPPGANFSPHVLVELHDWFGPENFVYWGLTK